MKQKFITRLAALLLAAMLLPQTAWALYGSGTYDDPYHVTLGKDLLTIADEVKEGKWDNTRMIVYLDNDVYLSRMITRIGTEAHPFRGSFDGNGHSINFSSPLNYGLNSNCTGVLFDYTSAAQICNITVNGKISSSTEGLTHIGGLVGYDNGGYFSQIEVNVDIDINGVAQKHIGGIIGHAESRTLMHSCVYNGVINAGTSTDCIGGIVGFVHADSNAEIYDCISTGSIYSSGSGPTMGGILGYNNNEKSKFKGVHNCFSRMGLHYTGSNAHVGGIAGRLRANATNTVNNFCLTDSCGGKAYNTDGPAIPASNLTCTLAECKSGYVTYTLNPECIQGTWQQKLGTDIYPTMWLQYRNSAFEFDVVYKVQDLKCDQTTAYGAPRYSNTNTVNYYHTGSWVDEVKPTCTTAGNIKHYHCTLCNKNYSSQTSTSAISNVTLDALGHDINAQWAWADNGQSTKHTRACKRTGCSYSKSATATYPSGGITRAQYAAATCYKKGSNKYTATVTIDGTKYSDSKIVEDIAMTAHNMGINWTWADDAHTATCASACTNEGCTHSVASSKVTYPNGGITRVKVSDATCTQKAQYKYTATATVGGTKHTDTKTVSEGDKLPHTFADGECTVCHEGDYLTFTSTGNSTIAMRQWSTKYNPAIEYSRNDGESWIKWDYSTLRIADGEKLQMRGENPTDPIYSYFVLTGSIAASGSIMSLIDGKGTSKVIPSEKCFFQLFYNCSALTSAPYLHATSLTKGCYEGMFDKCSSLTEAPALPATELQEDCYKYMFYQCSSLNRIEVAFTDWKATTGWVVDVAPTGTFVCPYGLPIDYNTSKVPEGWTVERTGKPSYLTGDVNGDGTVDVTDLNIVVSIIIGNLDASDFEDRADLNNDAVIDVIDANMILAIILNE